MLVGSAEVKINADTKDLAKQIQAELSKLDSKAKKAGKTMGEEMGKSMKSSFGGYVDSMATSMEAKLKKAGKDSGSAFGREFVLGAQTEINKMMNGIDFAGAGQKGAQQLNSGFNSNLDLTSGAKNQLTQLQNEASSAGSQAGRNFSQGMNNNTKFNNRGFGAAGRRGGDAYGGGFIGTFTNWIKKGSAAPLEGMIVGVVKNFMRLSMVGSVIYGVVAAVSSLVNGVIALASAVGQAIPALAGLGNVLAAAGQGMMTLKALFKGVPQAYQALTKANKAVSKSQKEATQTAEDLLERLLRIAQARLNLKKAILGQTRAEIDGRERVSDATEAYNDALREEEKAQRAVGEARKEAQERIEDLGLALEDASLSEERAVLNLKKAEKALNEARAGGNANQIYEADLAYREQELSLRQLQESNGDLREEADAAMAAGVEGSEDVIDAQEAHADAIEATEDALEDLKRAIQDFPLDMEEASLRVQQAILDLRKALLPPSNAVNGFEDTSAAMDELADAMAKLSPAAQKFVRYFKDVVAPEMERIKKLGQEEFFPRLQAGMELLMASDFPKVIERMFVGTSKALGDFAYQFQVAFTKPKNLGALERIFNSNIKIIEKLGATVTTLVDPFLQIGDALTGIGEGFTDTWLRAAQNFTEFIDLMANTKVTISTTEVDPVTGQITEVVKEVSKLEAFFLKSRDALRALWEMVKSFGGGLKAVFEAALPAGQYMIDQITLMGQAWSDTFDPMKNAGADLKKQELAETFQKSAENAIKMLDVITDLAGWFFRMGESEGVGIIADAIKEVLPQLEELASVGFDQIADDIASIITSLAGMAQLLAESQTLNVFFEGLALIANVLETVVTWMLKIPGGKQFIAIATAALGFYYILKLVVRLFGHGVGGIKKFKDGAVTAFGAIKGAASKAAGVITGLVDKIKIASAGRKAGKGFDTSTLQGSMDKAQAQTTARNAKQRELEEPRAAKKRESFFDETEKGIEKEKAAAKKKMDDLGKELGMDFSQGIEEGVRKAMDDMGKAGDDLAQALIAGINKRLGIASPSEEAEQVITQGMAPGFQQGAAKVVDDLTKVGSSLGDAITDGAKSGASGTEVVNNFSTEAKTAAAGAVGPAAAAGTKVGESMEEAAKVAANGGEVANNFGRELNTAAAGATGPAVAAGTRAGESMEEAAKIAANGGEVANNFGRELNTAGTAAMAGAGAKAGTTFKTAFDAAVPPTLIASQAAEGAGAATGAFALAGGKAGMAFSTSFDVAAGGLGGGKGGVGKAGGKVGGKVAGEGVEAAGKGVAKKAGGKAIAGAFGKVLAKGAAKQAIGSFLPGIGNIIMGLWTVIDIVMLLMMLFPELPKQIGEAFGKAWDWVVDFGKKVWGWVTDTLIPFMIKLSPIYWLIGPLKDAMGAIKDWWNKSAWPFLRDIPAKIAEFFSSAFKTVMNFIKKPVIDAYNWIADKVNRYVIENLNKLPFLSINKWPILSMAEGGPVEGPGQQGKDSVPAILAPGEYVLTNKMVKQIGVGNLEAWRAGRTAPTTPPPTTGGGAPVGPTQYLSLTDIPGVSFVAGKVTGGLAKAIEFIFRKMIEKLPKDTKYAKIVFAFKKWFDRTLGSINSWAAGKGDGEKVPEATAIPAFAKGGPVKGRYRGVDTMLARLTPGEYVLPRHMVKRFGMNRLESMRKGGMGRVGGYLYQDIPLAEDFTEKELERLLKMLREQEQFKYLKVSANEELFKGYLDKVISGQLEARKAAYDSTETKKALDKAYQEAYYASDSYILPTVPGMENLINQFPDTLFTSALEQMKRGVDPTTGVMAIQPPPGVDYATRQAIVHQVDINSEFVQALFRAYLEEVAKKEAEAAAAALAEAQAQTDIGSGVTPTAPPYTGSAGTTSGAKGPVVASRDTVVATASARSAKIGNVAKATGRPWVYPLVRSFHAKNFKGHRPAFALDIGSVPNVTALAIQDAVIAGLGDKGNTSYGKHVWLDHHDGTRSLYAHLNELDKKLRRGSKILSGMVLGKSGYTGGVRPSGPRGSHLHFELWRPGGSNGVNATADNMRGRGIYTGVTTSVKATPKKRYALGGVIPATPGGVEAILAEGGRAERVTPLDSQGRSTTEVQMLDMVREMLANREPGMLVTQNIYPSEGMSERELAQKVSRDLAYVVRRRS